MKGTYSTSEGGESARSEQRGDEGEMSTGLGRLPFGRGRPPWLICFILLTLGVTITKAATVQEEAPRRLLKSPDQAQSQPQSESTSQPNPQPQPQSQPQPPPHSQLQLQAQPRSESQPWSQAQAQPESQPQSHTQAQLQPQLQSESQPQSQSQPQPQSQSVTQNAKQLQGPSAQILGRAQQEDPRRTLKSADQKQEGEEMQGSQTQSLGHVQREAPSRFLKDDGEKQELQDSQTQTLGRVQELEKELDTAEDPTGGKGSQSATETGKAQLTAGQTGQTDQNLNPGFRGGQAVSEDDGEGGTGSKSGGKLHHRGGKVTSEEEEKKEEEEENVAKPGALLRFRGAKIVSDDDGPGQDKREGGQDEKEGQRAGTPRPGQGKIQGQESIHENRPPAGTLLSGAQDTTEAAPPTTTDDPASDAQSQSESQSQSQSQSQSESQSHSQPQSQSQQSQPQSDSQPQTQSQQSQSQPQPQSQEASAAETSPGAEKPLQTSVECPPERRAQLFHLTQEALLTHSSVFHSLMPWEPDGRRFIVMDCHTGRASNRLPCIQNHLVFAGLLNRSLVVDTLALGPTIHHYNWTLLVDIQHVRKCFGEKAIVTTAEWAAANQGRRMPIDAVLCWNSRCPTKWQWNTTSFEAPTFVRNLNGVSGKEPSTAKSYAAFQKYYLQDYVNVTTIFVGDLFKRAGEFPNTITDIYSGTFEDVPFLRRPGCPNAATLLPHHDIMAAAEEYVKEEFKGERFIALHWRGGDFFRVCKKNPSACFKQQEVVRCLMNEAQATGVANFLICSDMQWRTLEAFRKRLSSALEATKVSSKIILNPSLPKTLSSYQGYAKEGVGAYGKAVMANSFLFLGTNTSTFSRDVLRMRIGLGKAHCRDGYIYR